MRWGPPGCPARTGQWCKLHQYGDGNSQTRHPGDVWQPDIDHQQWYPPDRAAMGADHAPEVDMNGSNSIQVVKGSDAVRYGSEALGDYYHGTGRPAFSDKVFKRKGGHALWQ